MTDNIIRCFCQNQRYYDTIGCIFEFMEATKKADFEFLHPELEELKKKLVNDFIDFNEVLTSYIFGSNHPDFVSIPTEWEINQPKRLKEAKKVISNHEEKVMRSYQTFITKGRRILKV